MLNFLKKQPKGECITFSLGGMHCTSCAISIDDALEETEGVHKSEANYARAQVKVDFDPTIVTRDKLTRVIEAEGYQVLTENA